MIEEDLYSSFLVKSAAMKTSIVLVPIKDLPTSMLEVNASDLETFWVLLRSMGTNEELGR